LTLEDFSVGDVAFYKKPLIYQLRAIRTIPRLARISHQLPRPAGGFFRWLRPPSDPSSTWHSAFKIFGLIVLVITLGLGHPTLGASFTPPGDLPGGDFFSEATDVSADGSIVANTMTL
jgi:hypothetical protein